jgi:hypothetical protein
MTLNTGRISKDTIHHIGQCRRRRTNNNNKNQWCPEHRWEASLGHSVPRSSVCSASLHDALLSSDRYSCEHFSLKQTCFIPCSRQLTVSVSSRWGWALYQRLFACKIKYFKLHKALPNFVPEIRKWKNSEFDRSRSPWQHGVSQLVQASMAPVRHLSEHPRVCSGWAQVSVTCLWLLLWSDNASVFLLPFGMYNQVHRDKQKKQQCRWL